LSPGRHESPESGVSVRELRAVALEYPFTDTPDSLRGEVGPVDRLCHWLNDATWSSSAARTEGCLPLACLSEHLADPMWAGGFASQVLRRFGVNTLLRAQRAGGSPS